MLSLQYTKSHTQYRKPLNPSRYFYSYGDDMGRIKTQLIKRNTEELMERYGEHLKTDFEENKKVVSQYIDTSSKKMRNVIAGYATRLKKQGR